MVGRIPKQFKVAFVVYDMIDLSRRRYYPVLPALNTERMLRKI
jgi:hypothetical protein